MKGTYYMIDIKNRVTGYREFIAGEVLLAAAVVVIGMFSQGDLISSSFFTGSNEGSVTESPAGGPEKAPGEEAAAGATQSAASETPALS